MSTNNAELGLPISRYPIAEAARKLGCEPAAVLRMAGDGELPIYVHFEGLCGVAGCVVSPVAVGDSLGEGTGRVKHDGHAHLIFRNFQHGAELFISRVPNGITSCWRDAWVTLDGFWKIDANTFKDVGRNDGAPLILSAWSNDCGGEVLVAGNLPFPPGDPDLWVMAEDLRRLRPAPAPQLPIDPDHVMVAWSVANHWAEGKRPGKADHRTDEIKARFGITRQKAQEIEKKACPPEVMAERLKRSPNKK